jgi:hypothetical protein
MGKVFIIALWFRSVGRYSQVKVVTWKSVKATQELGKRNGRGNNRVWDWNKTATEALDTNEH